MMKFALLIPRTCHFATLKPVKAVNAQLKTGANTKSIQREQELIYNCSGPFKNFYKHRLNEFMHRPIARIRLQVCSFIAKCTRLN